MVVGTPLHPTGVTEGKVIHLVVRPAGTSPSPAPGSWLAFCSWIKFRRLPFIRVVWFGSVDTAIQPRCTDHWSVGGFDGIVCAILLACIVGLAGPFHSAFANHM